MEFAETAEWEIRLAWRQKVAAYWAISWPAWAISFILFSWLTSHYSTDELGGHLPILVLNLVLDFVVIQAIFSRRLVRKNYRSFRVNVIRAGTQDRRLSAIEALRVWLWILGPQLAFQILLFVGPLWFTPQATRALTAFSPLIQLFVVGPYAVGLAIRANYGDFRLQAYGYRYI